MKRTLTLAVIVAVLVGCQAAPQSASAPVDIAEAEYPRMFQAARQVLREEGFIVDRADYRFGVVTAAPRVTHTVVEPWHGNGKTFGQAAEASLNYQRRVVRVHMDPVEHTDKYQLFVEATVEQLERPTRYLPGSTRGNTMFGELSQVPEEWERRGITNGYWVAVERDPLLEQRLITAIVRRSVKVEPPENAPAPAPGSETGSISGSETAPAVGS